MAESVEYSAPEEFLSAIRKEAHTDAPFTVALYEDADGKTIPTDFTKDLESPFMEIKRESRQPDRNPADWDYFIKFLHNIEYMKKRTITVSYGTRNS